LLVIIPKLPTWLCFNNFWKRNGKIFFGHLCSIKPTHIDHHY